jgi:hypothetical protein
MNNTSIRLENEDFNGDSLREKIKEAIKTDSYSSKEDVNAFFKNFEFNFDHLRITILNEIEETRFRLSRVNYKPEDDQVKNSQIENNQIEKSQVVSSVSSFRKRTVDRYPESIVLTLDFTELVHCIENREKRKEILMLSTFSD